MKIISYLHEGLRINDELLNDIIFLCETRTKSTFFTRIGSSKMGFKKLIIFILNFVKKSLQLELDTFFSDSNDDNFRVSKQAFSKARKKISHEAFIKLSDSIIKWFYTDTEFKQFKGYRLLAIDGSILEVSNTNELMEEFGYAENQSVKVARAKASGVYDIENDMMLASKITKYTLSERAIAIELINKVEQLSFKNDLYLLDRGYPSKQLMSFIESKNQKYLMRTAKNYIKEITQTKEEDQVIEILNDKELLKIRVLRFKLDSGIEEVLITNILDKSFTTSDFKALYFKRWGIETKYNELKSRLQLENFTGETVIAVNQDFYASIYLTNMVSLAKKDADQIIQERNKDKELKYEYKVNTNILIGKLKNSLVLMMLETNRRKRSKLLKKIINEIAKNVIPKRPGRSFPRVFKSRINKYNSTHKNSL
jgi:hypothetical protein